MKMTRSLTNSMLVCGVAMAMASSLPAQTKQEGAWVVRVKGAVRYMPAGGTWQDLKVGTVLRAGCVVQTEKKAGCYVDLVLGGEPGGGVASPAAMPQTPFQKAMGGPTARA